MATVTVLFDGGDVPVLKGRKPRADNVPIGDPTTVVGTTNLPFLEQAGVRFYGLSTAIPHTPLWQKLVVADSVPQEITFSRITKPLEMG